MTTKSFAPKSAGRSFISLIVSSTTPNLSASTNVSSLLEQPTTRLQSLRSFTAFAKLPPIKPKPITNKRSNFFVIVFSPQIQAVLLGYQEE